MEAYREECGRLGVPVLDGDCPDRVTTREEGPPSGVAAEKLRARVYQHIGGGEYVEVGR